MSCSIAVFEKNVCNFFCVESFKVQEANMNESCTELHDDVIYSRYFDCTVFKMTVFIFLMYSNLRQPVDGIIFYTAGGNEITHAMTTYQCWKDYSFYVVRVSNFKCMRKK